MAVSYTYDCTLEQIAAINCSYIDDYFYFELVPITKATLLKKIEDEITEDLGEVQDLYSHFFKGPP